MTAASAPAVADLLWGSGQGLAAVLATYPVPASVLAAARNNLLTGNVWDTSGLDTYIGIGNGSFNGFPILNSQPLGTEISVWQVFQGTISVNSSPPAGSPQPASILLTPNGVGNSPHSYSGAVNCFPTVSYTVSSFLFPASAADIIGVGIDWFDGTSASGGNYMSTSSNYVAATASAWNSVSGSFPAPAGAHVAFPWAGNANSSPVPPAGHTINISGMYCTTPYS